MRRPGARDASRLDVRRLHHLLDLSAGLRVELRLVELAHLAKVGVEAVEAEHHEALEELVQLEAVVAALGALALHDALVGLARLESRVDLVGALEDRVDARHLEVVRREIAVEGKIGELT